MAPEKRTARFPLLVLALLAVATLAYVVLRPHFADPRQPAPDPVDDRLVSPASPDAEPLPESRGSVEGRVTEDGRPVVVRVELTLFAKQEPPAGKREITTDPEGLFEFEVVPPGEHLIAAVTRPGQRISKGVTVRFGGSAETVNFEISRAGCTLGGRAVHRDGRPFSGTIVCRAEGAEISNSAATDRNGRFRFHGLPPGQVNVWFKNGAAFTGFGPKLHLPREGEVLLVVDEEAETISGRVVAADTGEPIPDAVVVTKGWTHDQRHRKWRTLTDREGRFTTQAMFSGGLHSAVEVTAPGYWNWVLEYADKQPEYEIRLERSAVVTVRVVSSANGRPVPGVPVVMKIDQRNDGEDEFVRITDPDGGATFDVIPAFAVRFSVKGHGWKTDWEAPSAPQFPLLVSPGEKIEVELPAVRCARIEGEIVDSGGQRLRGARLHYRASRRSGSMTVPSGRFILDDLWDGPYTLRAYANGLEIPEVTGELVSGDIHRLTLRLPGGAWTTVQVTEEGSGGPVEGARIEVKSGGEWRTDAEGMARIGPLPAGDYEASVTHWQHRGAKAELRLAEGTVPVVTVPLPSGLSISGRVLLSDGSAADRGEVGWYGTVVGADGKRYQWHDERRLARISANGSFHLKGLPEGVLELHCSRWADGNRSHRGTFDVEAGARGVELTVKEVVRKPPEERQEFELLLVDPSGARVPMGECRIVYLRPDGQDPWDDHEEFVGGRAVFEMPEPGTKLFVLAYHARQPTGFPLPLGSRIVGPLDPEDRTATIALPPERTVSGFVRDPEGKGLGRVLVEGSLVWDRLDETVSSRRWAAWTAPDGSFSIGGFGECEVELVVDAPEGLLHPGPVRHPAGTSGIVITLDREISARMTVVDGTGAPVPGAPVRARLTGLDGLGEIETDSFEYYSQSARTDAAGVAVLTGLRRSGRYDLAVYTSKDRRDLGCIRVRKWIPRDETIALPVGLVVTGTVVGPDAAPVPVDKVNVWFWSPMGWWGYVKTTAGGRFEITSLPEGTIGLTLLSTGAIHPQQPVDPPEEGQPGVTLVPAGTRDVLLEYPPRK